jgi:hypothetical protein
MSRSRYPNPPSLAAISPLGWMAVVPSMMAANADAVPTAGGDAKSLERQPARLRAWLAGLSDRLRSRRFRFVPTAGLRRS